MKKFLKLLLIPITTMVLAGCVMPWEQDTDEEHFRSYEPLTGKFVLHDNLDKRHEYHDTYFIFNGAKGVFSIKYYENGELKTDAKLSKIVTHEDRIGKWCNNLSIGIEINKRTYYHMSTYTESFEPLNQFRIIEEYKGFDERFYLSELPYVMGTYVREGSEYKEKAYHTNTSDPLVPNDNRINVAFDGTYKFDDNHYFYFLSPRGWVLPDSLGYFYDSYFQYFAPGLDKPLEGFANGWKTEKNGYQINLKVNRNSVNEWKYPDQMLYMGYPYTDDHGSLDYKYGSVDYLDGVVNSFTFEKISRSWSDGEWNKYISGKEDLPDPVQYGYVGGTYTRVIEQQ